MGIVVIEEGHPNGTDLVIAAKKLPFQVGVASDTRGDGSRNVPAITYEAEIEFDGVPMTLRARLMIDGGRVVAVRRLVLLDRRHDTAPPSVVNGYITVNADGSIEGLS